MVGEVYRELARRLDEIPNGFASTESGAEFDLLAKLFTPEEAALAVVMTLSPETPEGIAERAGADSGSVETRLREMRAKGLIGARKDQSGASYSLIPFIVGIYENQLTSMDEELARLVERYIVESRGGSPADGGTAVHRVIPVEQSVPLDLEIFPYERATRLLDRARSWGVRDCICRVQQKLVGKGCDHTVENCLIFSPQAGAFDDGDATRPVSRDEAQRILSQAAEEGLVHSTMNQRDQIHYICNCCTCCCGIMRGVAEFGVPTAVARSDFRVSIAEDGCTGCGACTRRCQFGALSNDGDVCVVDYAHCVGCGVCVSTCPVEAMAMERRPAGDVDEPPENLREWMARRVEERGMSEGDVP